jgi:hypothetical protein
MNATSRPFINEKETRALAGVVFTCCVIFLLTQAVFLFWFLLFEFTLRALTNTAYTPLKMFDNFILSVLKIQPGLIPPGPKKLAAVFGLIFCICVLSSYYLGYILTAKIFVGVMTLFSFLEFSISFCLATKIYNAVVKNR